MTNIEPAHHSYRRDLGDGLVLRWSTAEDTENIVELIGSVFVSAPTSLSMNRWDISCES